MTKKNNSQLLSVPQAQLFLKTLTHDEYLNTLLIDAQNYITQLTPPVNICLQIEDIQSTLASIKAKPLTYLQLNRLINTHAIEFNHNSAYFDQFKSLIIDHVKISETSRIIIDPYSTSEMMYSSKIANYKKWLCTILFLLRGFSSEYKLLDATFLEDALFYINCIYPAVTTSRISLRLQAQIDAATLTVIPRNTLVKVHGSTIDTHWVKISVSLENQNLEGYIPVIYINRPLAKVKILNSSD